MHMTASSYINHIRDALGTEETGAALIEVARNAHKAEQELAAWKAQLNNQDMSIDDIAHWVYKKLNEGN
jgi:predicted nucleic acid-binding protein